MDMNDYPVNPCKVVAMRPANFLRVIPVLFLLSGTASSADPAPATDAAPAAANAQAIGQVIWVKGTVKAATGDASPRTLERRSPLYQGDVITTDPSGTGEIAFTDSSIVSLRSSTEFKVDAYNYKPGGPPAESKSVMSLVKGGFRTITGAIPKENPDAYQVNTPVATIGVRGTNYSAFYSKQEGLVTKIDLGRIIIKNQFGQTELNKALQNVYSIVKFNEAPQTTTKPPAVFNTGQPPLVPVAPSTISNIYTIQPGGSIPGGGPITPPGGVPTQPKTVSGFCISLLQDVYRKASSFFS